MSSFVLNRPAGSRAAATTFLMIFCVFFGGKLAAQTLRYQAYLAGLPVGIATIHLDITTTRYEVSGFASTNGVARLFGRWKTQFEATGLIVDDVGVLETYRFDEQYRHKHTRLYLRDGYIQVTKNGKRRPRRPAVAGVDVLTALFVHPRCEDQLLHTGRDNYALTRIEATEAGVCRYTIIDDDGDPHRAEMVFEERNGVLVPVRFKVRKPLPWSMVLLDAQRS